MNLEALKDRILQKSANQQDWDFIHMALKEGRHDLVSKVIQSYCENYQYADTCLLFQYVDKYQHSGNTWMILNGLRFSGNKDQIFLDHILNFANGVDWDQDESIRATAVSNLYHLFPVNKAIENIVGKAFNSELDGTRIAAMFAAQLYCGVPIHETITHYDFQRFYEKLDDKTKRWLKDISRPH